MVVLPLLLVLALFTTTAARDYCASNIEVGKDQLGKRVADTSVAPDSPYQQIFDGSFVNLAFQDKSTAPAMFKNRIKEVYFFLENSRNNDTVISIETEDPVTGQDH
jgi:hypothetical protein